MSTIFAELTQTERDEYERLVSFVRSRRKAFAEVLDAVGIIRQKKLYRESYTSFEEFCQKELGLGRQSLDRLERVQVNKDRIRKHAPEVQSRIQTEKAINALESIPNAKIAEVVKAADTGKPLGPTENEIRNAAIRLAVDVSPYTNPKPEKKSPADPVVTDSLDSIEIALVTDAKRAIAKFFQRVPGVEEQAAFICKHYHELALAIVERVQRD